MLRPEPVGLSRILLLTSQVSSYTQHQAIMYAEAHINPFIVYFEQHLFKSKTQHTKVFDTVLWYLPFQEHASVQVPTRI